MARTIGAVERYQRLVPTLFTPSTLLTPSTRSAGSAAMGDSRFELLMTAPRRCRRCKGRCQRAPTNAGAGGVSGCGNGLESAAGPRLPGYERVGCGRSAVIFV